MLTRQALYCLSHACLRKRRNLKNQRQYDSPKAYNSSVTESKDTQVAEMPDKELKS
jgi:hypothetical protein